MNKSKNAIKNIIFDLGGVILDLSVEKTLKAFAEMAGRNSKEVQQIFLESEGFLAYEKGDFSDEDFRNYVREIYAVKATDTEIDRCWNAMLLGLPIAKVELLKKLKERFNVYLLSNTNNIHLSYINQNIVPHVTGKDSLDIYFDKAYYSHLMGKRKPDAEIFEQVLEENNLEPGQTLFFDDNANNIAGARALGLQTEYVDTPDFILHYF